MIIALKIKKKKLPLVSEYERLGSRNLDDSHHK